jgi:23S rRNA G2445 N2-methylase RlmL
MQWPSFDAGAWDRLVKGADSDVIDRCPVIVGSDRDEGAVAAALANAATAGVAENIAVERRSASDLVLPATAGWIVSNPPYGARVGGPDVRDLYDRFGNVLRERAAGWHVALLASRDTPVARLKLPLVPMLETSNGGIHVAVQSGVVPA